MQKRSRELAKKALNSQWIIDKSIASIFKEIDNNSRADLNVSSDKNSSNSKTILLDKNLTQKKEDIVVDIENIKELEEMSDELSLFMQNEIDSEMASRKESVEKQSRRKVLNSNNFNSTNSKKSKQKSNKLVKDKEMKKRFFKPLSKWFSYSLGYSTSLENIIGEDSGREQAKLTLNISPVKYFFIGATFAKTLNSVHNKYYEPDFSYTFGYSDWHQDTWSLVYSNYSDNKFSPDSGYNRFNFSSGTWDLSYKTKIKDVSLRGSLKYTPKSKKAYLSLSASKKIYKLLGSVQYKRYLHTSQDQLTLSLKGFIYKKFYASGSVYLYSNLNKQTSQEPDYAFSFGWKDSKKRRLTIMYSNYYTPTRFFWRKKKGPSFAKGSISLSMRF